MPTWGEILSQLAAEQEVSGPLAFDIVRRTYLAALSEFTGNCTILYATKWTVPSNVQPDLLQIVEEDVQGLMEVVHGVDNEKLDLILHSPGGSPEATEAFVTYLRSKFRFIRVIVPHAAMSAATMLACAADEIIMGKHSFLGPIDPQMIVPSQYGAISAPAQAILDQFEMAKKECKDPQLLGSWMPILSQFGPALLVECQEALELAKTLVREWLLEYMFKEEETGGELAAQAADKLAAHGDWMSHARHISRDAAEKTLNLRITYLEDDERLQDLVLSVFHAASHTFNGTPAVKLIENHLGKAFIKQHIVQQMVVPAGPSRPASPQQRD